MADEENLTEINTLTVNVSDAQDNPASAEDTSTVTTPLPTSSIGNYVFEDLNANGIQDSGESGIPDAEVKLLNADGTPVEDESGNPITTNTDGSGFYEFTGLTPGEYKVMFVQPDGFEGVSPVNAGGDDVDSDADPNNNLITGVITLNPGQNDDTNDAGFFKTASIGDFVFNDENQNGIQDIGESGIPDAEVKLLDVNGDPVLDQDGNEITTTTDGNGAYQFTGLTPGEYKVMFVQPEGFEGVSPVNAGGDDVDSDADPNNGLMSDVITLSSGDENDTVDAGFFNNAPGPNIIDGTSGMDMIEGTSGNDIITGFEGRDMLTGGDGNDIFVYTQLLDQRDDITDFQSGSDKLDFSILLGNESNFYDEFPEGTVQDAIDNSYIIPYDLGAIYGMDGTWFVIDPDGNTGGQAPENIVVLNGVSSINPNGNVFNPNTDMIV
ncbi:SdrD B-like domain-containing protein [Okeania sp. SIO1H5]|uniref:SdrD B-like domain-containing protein n=1 Tax=Okeania sp. SIO1H5 TaxID=2607777 RepID=UPI00338E773E